MQQSASLLFLGGMPGKSYSGPIKYLTDVALFPDYI